MAAKPIYAVGLDAGSHQTRMVICVLERGRIRFLGAASAESQGWLKGRVADQKAVAASMIAALHEAEICAQANVGSAVVGVGGPTLRGANGRGVLELGFTREIEQRDVNRVIDRASRVRKGADDPLAPFPNLKRLFESVNVRPAAVRARDVGKDHPFKKVNDEETKRALFPSNYPPAA